MTEAEPGRRSQVERSARTISRLLDAAISAVVDVGYEGATTREIGRRAGVSQGGLFRHFRSRRDLLLAALVRLHERQLEALTAAATAEDGQRLLETIRDLLRAPEAVFGLEMSVAARTDADLLDGIRPVIARHRDATADVLRGHPRFEGLTRESLQVWLDIVQRAFQAEALWFDTPPSNLDADAKLDALTRLLDHFIAVDRHRGQPLTT
jgi:AcrR family transcriptional regulator